jgi:hypothetical protein
VLDEGRQSIQFVRRVVRIHLQVRHILIILFP